MNTTFNQALKQSTSLRKDLTSLSTFDASQPTSLTSGALGSLSASLTAFSRTLNEYSDLAKQEINPGKQEKAYERLKNFRGELVEYKGQFERLKTAREDAVTAEARSELFGRRSFVTSTPENPYANAAPSSGGYGVPSKYSHARMTSAGERGQVPGTGDDDVTRESHALREQSFFASTNSALDDYIQHGQAVLGDLNNQRAILKGAQKRLFSVGNTLGLSSQTIRMVERRAKEDKWIFAAGVVVFFLFCWLCVHFLR